MYYDLSIQATNSIQLRHLLSRINSENHIKTIAIDFQFKGNITEPGDKQKQIIQLAKSQQFKNIKVFTRSTLIVDQSITLHQLSQTQKAYDILAVKPTNQKMFHTLCTEYDNYDLICFQMGVKMPYMLKRNPIYDAIRKGKFFQIQYDPIFDQNTRVICMTNMLNIIKATKRKNLIISSHAASVYRHRTPYDTASLLISLGMNKNQILACMKENSETALKSAVHRQYFKGSIKQISTIQVKKLSKTICKHREKFRKLKEKSQKEQK